MYEIMRQLADVNTSRGGELPSYPCRSWSTRERKGRAVTVESADFDTAVTRISQLVNCQ